jgi:branched-chain amino acid transport system permease protein
MDYLIHIAVMACLYVILTSSFNLLIGYAGLFALAHAGFFAVGAYTTAILSVSYGLPFPVPMLIGAVLTAGVGAFIALPALRTSGHYLVIITLAFQVILLAFLLNVKDLTGGADGITGIERVSIFGFELATAAEFLPLALIMAAICFWICWRVANSPFGRSLRAMRENEAATEAVGKNILYMKVTVFMVGSALAAVAGSLYARYITFVGVDTFAIDETIYILAMVILGGMANLWGSIVGAVILVLLPELLKFLELPPDIADKSREIIYGLLLIIILRVRPQGILPERETATTGGLAEKAQLLATKPLLPDHTGRDAPGAVSVSGKNLAKHFGGIVAVDDFSIELKAGTVVGLIGPNGAGKTTAFNLLTGFLKPTAGEIVYRGRNITGLKPHQVVRAGMARSFQDLKLFTRLTVLENVMVALPEQHGDDVLSVFFAPRQIAREEVENYSRAMQILEFVNLANKAQEKAENLSYAEEKLLVVARLLATGADVLLFDEPLSGLDPNTLKEIFPVIRRLAEDGKTVCIIEHNLDVIKGVCDHVVFLDEGRGLAEGAPDELLANPTLAERYFA